MLSASQPAVNLNSSRWRISMRGLIDPPSSGSPTKEWQAFLASLDKEDQNDRDVKMFREMGRKELELRRRATKPWWIGGEKPA
jgi:hypothetical protein